MSPAQAALREAQAKSLPVIDLTGFGEGDAARDVAVAAAVRHACEDKGFFYVAGHGVAPELIDAMRAQAEAFFALPHERKVAISKDLSHCNRGYEPLAAQTLEKGAPPDQKEGFYIGVEIDENDPRVKARKFNHGPNQWPSNLPRFRATSEAYFAAMVRFGTSLMEAMALSLDLPRDFFSRLHDRPDVHLAPAPLSAPARRRGSG